MMHTKKVMLDIKSNMTFFIIVELHQYLYLLTVLDSR